MSSTTQIDVAFDEQLESNLIIRTQQKASKFYDKVTVKSVVGAKSVDVARLGALDGVEEIDTRPSATILSDINHSRIRLVFKDFYKATYLTQEDEIKTLIDFQNPYVGQLAAVHGRNIDDLCIAAAVASATTVDNTGSTSTEAVKNTVATSVGGNNTDLNIEKMLRARRTFEQEEVDVEMDQLYLAIDPIAKEALLQETQVISSDYSFRKALAEGKVDDYMGYNIFVSNRLQDGTNQKTCLAFVKSGITLGINQGMKVEIDKRADLKGLTQLSARMSANAVRTENEKVIPVYCYRA